MAYPFDEPSYSNYIKKWVFVDKKAILYRLYIELLLCSGRKTVYINNIVNTIITRRKLFWHFKLKRRKEKKFM